MTKAINAQARAEALRRAQINGVAIDHVTPAECPEPFDGRMRIAHV